MDWVALGVITLACAIGLWYAKRKVDTLVAPPTRLLASLTCKVGLVNEDGEIARKDKMWFVTCRVFSDGTIKFEGDSAEEYFKSRNEEYHKYIVPLSLGGKVRRTELATIKGVEFHD